VDARLALQAGHEAEERDPEQDDEQPADDVHGLLVREQRDADLRGQRHHQREHDREAEREQQRAGEHAPLSGGGPGRNRDGDSAAFRRAADRCAAVFHRGGAAFRAARAEGGVEVGAGQAGQVRQVAGQQRQHARRQETHQPGQGRHGHRQQQRPVRGDRAERRTHVSP
jgi:hypothetical protein